MGEGGKEFLVDRVALPVDTLFLVHLRFEPPALLVRVGELAEGVRKLDAADIQLEALGDTRVARRRPRKRRLDYRVFAQDRGAPEPEIRLDALDEHPAEDVRPGIVRGNADAGPNGAFGELRKVGLAAGGERAEKVDAGVALERLRDGHPLRLEEGVRRAAAVAQLRHAGGLGGERQKL